MSNPLDLPCSLAHVTVLARDTVFDLPGRFSEAGLVELLQGLGGTMPPASDDLEGSARVWKGLTDLLSTLPTQDLGEQLLDAVLLEPPIPAGCEAMLRAMADLDTAPWRTHEILADRLSLWHAHQIVARTLPDQFPPPPVEKVRVQVALLQPTVRPPGKRSTPRERSSFVARALLARDGDNPLSAAFGLAVDGDAVAPVEWCFDTLWAVQLVDRDKPAADALQAMGATAEDAASGRLLRTTFDVWCDAAWCGDLTVGQAYTAQVAVG